MGGYNDLVGITESELKEMITYYDLDDKKRYDFIKM